METEVKSETTETTVNQRKDSERCQVEWRLKTPDTWRVEQIKQTLENVSGMLRQWFHIEFIYVGSLVLHTSVPRHILRDRQCLKSAIQSFLEKIVEICEINTDVPETVNVDFRVFEMTSHTDMEMEFFKAESEDSNDHDFSQLKKTTGPFEVEEPPYKMPRLPGHGKAYSDDIMCQLCISDQIPVVYWCTECVQAMCRECTTVHHTQLTSSTHTMELLTRDYNFQIKATDINDIASLCEGVLIIIDGIYNQLITCDVRGHNKQFIPLPYSPYKLSVIDQNNVAITTISDKKVLIVDVKQKTVTIEIDIKKNSTGIMYRDNHLYVGCDDKSLVKVDMSGEIIRTVLLSFTPWCICSGTEGHIYCTDYFNNTVHCIDTEGNTVFTVTYPFMSYPYSITTNNEGHVLVVCDGSNTVHRISPDGKQCNVIIKDIPLRNISSPCICYDSISKSILISNDDTVYVYKEKPEQ